MWSVSTWFSPTHQERFVISGTSVCQESNALHLSQAAVPVSARIGVVRICSSDAKKKKKKKVSPCSVKADTALTRQKGFL